MELVALLQLTLVHYLIGLLFLYQCSTFTDLELALSDDLLRYVCQR